MRIAAVPSSFSVLIIEDDDDARNNMEDILLLDGYRIRTASHCLPALQAIEGNEFDAVIIDWRLPDGSGGDLIPMIHREQPDIPVIVVTGMRDFETPVEALRKGAYDFLTKPINPDMLRAVLRRLVERKRHLNEISEAQEQVLNNERLAAIGQMVAGLAHESRNAFQRSHACLAELSLDLTDRPESLRLVGKVQRALDDINRLLEEVRRYAAPIILERRTDSLKRLINDAWQDLLDAAPDSVPPEFILTIAPDFPDQSFIDVDRIKRVIRNLLENAWFACPPENGKITVRCTRFVFRQPNIRIAVTDNGEGVPEGNRDKVFSPFFTTKTKGTGLGLAICQRIAGAHDGRLALSHFEDSGATFTLEMPQFSADEYALRKKKPLDQADN